jgi:hypothetical protein
VLDGHGEFPVLEKLQDGALIDATGLPLKLPKALQ